MAGRLKGSQKTGGRKAGTPNRDKLEVRERLAEMGCDPIDGMAQIAMEARAEGDKHLAGQMYKELCKYSYPQKKAVEVTGKNGGAIDHSVNVVIEQL